jgi:PAS domain S-box-containing protein
MRQQKSIQGRQGLLNEQSLQILVETIPTLVWRAKPDGHIDYINKRLLEYLGSPLEEIIGWGWMEKVHPDDVAFKVQSWLSNLEAMTSHDANCRFQGADGAYRWFSVRGEPLRDGDGHVQNWYGVLIDIDNQKKAEDALRESETQLAEAQRELRRMIDTIPIPLASYSADAKRDFVNAAWKQYTGLSDEAALSSEWSVVAHPDHIATGKKMWRDALAAGEPWHTEERVRRADGQYHWFAIDRVAARDENGKIIKWYGTAYDIEDRKRAEDALRESEAKFRDYAETASDWFWEIGPDYKLTLLTENAFGSHSADRLGTGCWDHALDLETETEKWRILRATLDSRRPFRDFIYRGLGGNGAPMYVKVSGKPVLDPAGGFRGYRGTGTDVTAIMRAQEESERLRQLEADLAHMNRLSMMGELAASLAHEITQPIATARNNASAAMRFLDRRPPDLGEVREALACLVDDADRAGDIIDRIRDHIQKAPPRKECFDLNEAINEVIGLARSAIVKNRVSVQTRLAERSLAIHGDRVQLQQVLLNLILNAVEAMGAVEAGARELLISTEQDPTGVLVAVRDSGPGIDATHLERVFEAFYTTKSSGVGMGLSICRSIIDAHGGRLRAQANEPRGAVFQFTLPSTDRVSELAIPDR